MPSATIKPYLFLLKDSLLIAFDYMEAYAKMQENESVVELRNGMQDSMESGDAIEFMRCKCAMEERQTDKESRMENLQKIVRNPEQIIDNPKLE